jgi:plasmid maintenance system antidote protein VapI
MKKLKPVTPGEILLEEFLKSMPLSEYRLTKEIDVPARRMSMIQRLPSVSSKKTIMKIKPFAARQTVPSVIPAV